MKNDKLKMGIKRAWNKTKRNITRPDELISNEMVHQYNMMQNKVKQIGTKNTLGKNQGAIYIGELLSENIDCLNINRYIFAKGLAQNLNCDIIPLFYQKSSKNELKLKTFGFKGGEKLHNKSLANFLDSIHAIHTICRFEKKNGDSVDALLNLEIDGVMIGETIYDFIIRKNAIPTIEILQWDRDFYYFWEGIKTFYVVRRQFQKKKPLFYICWDACYLEGVAVELASKMGARIISMALSSNAYFEFEKKEYMYDWDYSRRKKIEEVIGKDIDINIALNHVEKLLSNKKCVTDFVLRKKNSGKKITLKHDKKNIIIFIHNFYDCVRYREGMVYRDYYEWLLETIKIIRDVDTVNWYIKEHPTSSLFNKYEETFKEIEFGDNIQILPMDISNEQLFKQMDGIVTCGGTAAAEYACLGIPAITVSKAWYTGFGYTIDSSTKEEYERNLRNVHNMNKLNEKQIETAKRVLSAFLSLKQYNPNDTLDRLTMESEIMCWNGGYDNFTFINKVLEIADLSKTEAYQNGKNW